MPELVSLSEAARRFGISRQAMAELSWRPDFPPTRMKGRSKLVSWPEVKEWRETRQQDAAREKAYRDHCDIYDRYRADLWNTMRSGGYTPLDCRLILGGCYTVDALRAKAVDLGYDPDDL